MHNTYYYDIICYKSIALITYFDKKVQFIFCVSMITKERLTTHRIELSGRYRFIEFAVLQCVGEVLFDYLTRKIVKNVYKCNQVGRRWY